MNSDLGSLSTGGAVLRQVLDQSVAGVVLLDATGRLVYANPAFFAATGYATDECRGWLIDHLVLPGERADLRLGFAAIRDGEATSYCADHGCVRKDGSTMHTMLDLSALEDGDGSSPYRYFCQIVNTGIQKQVDAALQEAEWRWNQALRGSRQVVWDFHVPTGLVWVSPGWKELLDLAEEERVHRIEDWLDKMHPDDRERVAEATAQVSVSGATDFDSVYRLRHQTSGRWVWVLSRGKVVEFAQDGSIVRMIGTIVDITLEKGMEERLAAVTERLEIALAVGGIGIFDLDLTSDVLTWDERTYALHGTTPQAFDHTSEGFFRLLHAGDADRIRRVRAEAYHQGVDYQAEYRVPDPISGAARYVRMSVRLIRGSTGEVTNSIGVCWDITEDVERARKLNETLALLEAVLVSTPDLVFAKDTDGRYLLVNPAVERVMGRPAEQIVGQRDIDIFPSEIAARLIENDRRALDDQLPYTVEEHATVGGIDRAYSSTKAPLRDGSGDVIGLIGISRDVTDIQAAESALRHSELRWQFALDGSGDGIWDWDIGRNRVFYSRQWKSMLGYADSEIGDTVAEWSARVHPDDLARCLEIINTHFQNDTPDFTLEHRMRAKDGSWRWIYDRGKVIERGPDGHPQRVIGTHTDITARKENESAILALNQRLQLAIEAAGAGIFEVDLIVQRYSWDERMHQLYGLSDQEYDGTLEGWLGFIHPGDVSRVMEGYEAAIEETSVFSMDFRICRYGSAGVRHIRSLARIIRDGKGRPERAVGMNWDITDHKELAETLFEEKERLRITLHSIGDAVLSTDAHERVTFMNPIAEQLTEWSAADAVGHPLAEIFPLVDESGMTLPDPIATCLEQSLPFHLDSNVVMISREGQRRHVRSLAAPVRTSTGEVIGAVLVFQDVTKARTLQQALEHSANHDNLTGLPNRAAFERRLRAEMDHSAEDHFEHTLCFIDLDRFKLVNDSAGHAAGDALLREIAAILRRNSRHLDIAARLGGDEFALLLVDCPLLEGEKIARRFQGDVAQLRFSWEGVPYYVGASIGLTAVTGNSRRADTLLNQADIACYTSKTSGRNQVSIYDDGASASASYRREAEAVAGIRNAIEQGRFRLYAQDTKSLRYDGGAGYVEILLRMLDDEGLTVEPGLFIPAAESYDLMGNVDRWVIRTVLQEYGGRLRAARDTVFAINLSGNSLNDPFLWPYVQEQLSASGLPANALCFEITETAAVNNVSAARQFVSLARAAGCLVYLDDFGKGYSSFSYLRHFPVDGIKIDGDFVRNMVTSPVDYAIVESINTIAHRLGVPTIAEHIEDVATLELARSMGIDRAQGFAIAGLRPLGDALGRAPHSE
ncbi:MULTISPECIES: bifunctional diguanylate cyclase/phosphodiesterase [unclassified Lysobacter]|uniref:bifunctional diguanylate cyclase/phosphodiesterase n=1 Tax=unclassified Lysobacter TaxID=2635362 RepID=UPI001BE64657|nr:MULTISPECIES: bifunctional diguanylate cyclase/phosphodiesterase [unclassified Lysobacter]MBT2750055.1 PAS domain-containing protein [Lysobacter sp. ISL-50]MBT2775373.1 PAS domain-containing protein [Lysobacter sp. ISL-54]MBT2783496.1 PAS domain-containing protein [Lysobacter sp. ISL-52]